MMALVDTPIWSLALRRRRGGLSREVVELTKLIREGRAEIIGPIRQELLSGIRIKSQFVSLREHLRAFPDVELTTDDFELAAEFYNRCRASGVQGSNTDFLICAVASRRHHSVFTTDDDFASFARLIPLALHAPRAGGD
jgi:predicted nucleic acid-binding protein